MRKFILGAAAALTLSGVAHAEGYQINTLSARQLGMAHTGVAQKLGAESMIFNPAGLGFSNKTLDLSGSVTAIRSLATATVDGTKYSTDSKISTPFSVNAAFRVYDNLQVGVNFYTPYGSGINWTKNWPGAVLSQNVSLKMFTVQPTVAWRILPNLSVGAGLMMTWGNVNLDKGLISAASFDGVIGQLLGITLGNTTPASVNLKGNSELALGANVGAMWDISPRVTVGASFRTKMTMKVKSGVASVDYANEAIKTLLEPRLGLLQSANFAASMPAPYVLSFGASWRPIDRLTLALDAQLTGWSAYKHLNIDFLDENLTAYDQNITKKYHNSWAVRLGGQYAVTNRFDVRLGLMVDTSPVNDEHYNPETPGMTKLGPSCGLTFRPIDQLSIDFGFMYVAGLGKDNASCTYPDFLTGQDKTFTADYHVHAFTPALGLRYAF